MAYTLRKLYGSGPDAEARFDDFQKAVESYTKRRIFPSFDEFKFYTHDSLNKAGFWSVYIRSDRCGELGR
jgi:hypothetical protein